MGSNAYEILINSAEVYPTEILTRLHQNSINYHDRSAQRREWKSRHDYVCYLLCNTTSNDDPLSVFRKRMRERMPGDPELEPAKRLMLGRDPVSLQNLHQREEEEEESEEEEDLEIEEEMEIADASFDPILDPEVVATQAIEKSPYRFHCLESHSFGSLIQNFYCNKWNFRAFDRVFDIVDKKEKKFIEVKVTLNVHRAALTFDEAELGPNALLYAVNPESGEVLKRGFDEELNGEGKVREFLGARLGKMASLEITDSIILEEEDLAVAMFRCKRFNDAINVFVDFYKEGMEEPQEAGIQRAVRIDEFETEAMWRRMKDVTEVEGPSIQWKAKLHPGWLCHHLDAFEEDKITLDAVFELLTDSELTLEAGDERLFTVLKSTIDKWNDDPNPSKNFGLWNLKRNAPRSDVPEELKWALGIGAKERKFEAHLPGAVQEEFAPLVPHKYEPWFDEIIKQGTEAHKFRDYHAISLDVEKEETNYMTREFQLMVDKIFGYVAQANVGFEMSTNMNFYSRLGSTYLAQSKGMSAHHRIAIWPIVTTLRHARDPKLMLRKVSGFCLRGMHHARSATDKVNVVLAEFVVGEQYKEMYPKCTIINVGGAQNLKLMIRQQSVMKMASTHLMFCLNTMFVPGNFLGDVIMAAVPRLGKESFKEDLERVWGDRSIRRSIVERVNESFLMAILGNSRDEGFFAMFRKVAMVMINSRRNLFGFTWNLDEFFEKYNECLLDNPLGMHFHNSFMYILACKLTRSIAD